MAWTRLTVPMGRYEIRVTAPEATAVPQGRPVFGIVGTCLLAARFRPLIVRDMAEFVGAVDQGTTNTRFMIFDHGGNEVARHQLEHEQIMPQPGWVEHDPAEIWERTRAVIKTALRRAGLRAGDLAAVGIANQRETTLVWNRRTGRPYYNAIVWQDTRTDRIAAAAERDGRGDIIRKMTGLPTAACFSGSKIQWILENIDGVRGAAERGDALFGTVDSWLLWQLTGGADGGVHITDPTNASRTMLMDLATLNWDDQLLSFFDIPRPMLPEIRPSADPRGYGVTRPDGPFGGEVRLAGDLGDQQAAIVGQACFGVGEAKNTYGTGSFLLLNVGTEPIRSDQGLLSTVCYQFGDAAPVYALEGSIAVTGSAVQWLRDQLGVISGAAQSEALAGEVDGTAGVYFVPAFSGLFAPHWRPDARGAIVGLSRSSTSAHLARATLEAICYQTRDVVEAMRQDCGVTLGALRVDGGVTANELCMQIQADILGVPVSRPFVAETTALGAAYAAGLAVKFWGSLDELRQNWQEDRRWQPQWDDGRRAHGYAGWKKAVDRTLGWADLN
jgi:glycerol kinase